MKKYKVAFEKEEPVHEFFELSYASYQVIPRSILQSMPVEWQKRFVALMRELDEKCHEHGIACGPYKVYAHDERGRFKSCPFGSYERGRRNVFEERKRTG